MPIRQRTVLIAGACALLVLASCAPSRWIVAVRNSTDQEYLVRVTNDASVTTRLVRPAESGNVMDEPTSSRGQVEIVDPRTCEVVLQGDLLAKSTSVVIGVDLTGLTLSIGAKSLISEPQLLQDSSLCRSN